MGCVIIIMSKNPNSNLKGNVLMKMKCLKMIVVSLTVAAVCTALTGCGKEEADVTSVTSSANESKHDEITTTEAKADIVLVC